MALKTINLIGGTTRNQRELDGTTYFCEVKHHFYSQGISVGTRISEFLTQYLRTRSKIIKLTPSIVQLLVVVFNSSNIYVRRNSL
jgi:hypothetical protein